MTTPSGLISLALAVALVSACGGGKTDSATSDGSTGTTSSTTDTPGTTGSSTTAPTTGSTSTSTTSTTTSTSSPTTTLDPTNPTNPTDPGSTGGENCDPGYSAGCCFGDGVCCPCVGFDCDPSAPDAAIEAFQQCACQQDVCADACAYACAGGGIDISCFLCADKAAQTTCQAPFMACSGHLDASCDPPQGCDACQYCALTGACYDAWFACYSAGGDCQDIIRSCEPMCGDDPACLQDCAADFPGGAALYQTVLECMYCSECADACGDVSVACGP